MKQLNPYEFAAGSTIGTDHRRTARNNQDAWHLDEANNTPIGIVADGCGSGRWSEIGARTGTRYLVQQLRNQLVHSRSIDWNQALWQTLEQIDQSTRALGGNYRTTVTDFFLFTVVGFVVLDEEIVFFSLGDGTIVINGEVDTLGPFIGNAPPYMAYGLLRGSVDIDPALIRINVRSEPISSVETFLIGTDGVEDIRRHENTQLPGLRTVAGPLSQFWQDDKYYANPSLVSRRLNLMARRDWPHANPEPGLLSDDTTLIAGRRRHGES